MAQARRGRKPSKESYAWVGGAAACEGYLKLPLKQDIQRKQYLAEQYRLLDDQMKAINRGLLW